MEQISIQLHSVDICSISESCFLTCFEFWVENVSRDIDKLNKLNDAQVKDDFIDFEKLGFDKFFIDECHMYKNLATATKMHNVSGLGSGGSARSFNLLMKSKYMDELTGGKGMVFASGTPIITSYSLKIPKFTVGEKHISDGFFYQKQK